MKHAKKRMLPMIARLNTSTRRADRAMTAAHAAIRASNKRLARKNPRYTLTELIGQSHGGLHIDKEWDLAPPVGRELL